MMAKAIWKAGTLLAPVPPVLVSCGTLEKPNVLTIAWTGIVNTNPPMTYISVRPERYSHDIIADSGEFVVNLSTVALLRATDFCGVKSGRDTDKCKLCKLTAEAASQLGAPMIAESPLSIECRVKKILPLGSHDMFLAEIVAVNVDSKLIDKAGKLDLSAAGLLAYAHGEYFELGKRLGTFGYSVRKKPPARSTTKKREPRESGKNK